MTGRLYRYEFDNILMVYMQRPNATLVADYDTWKDPRVGRYVKRGSKGIAIFPSRALKPYMRYVFDISDTGGRNTRLTWELDEKNMEAYAAYLGRKNEDKKESAETFLKDFTENRIGVIMDSEFGERITELVHLAGTKRIMVDDETQEITAEEALKRSVMYAVFTRCGFDFPSEKQDFSFITAFSSEEEVYRLGSLVSDISCEVLKSIAKELTQMERSIAYANNDLSRSGGRDAVPEPDITRGEHFHDESRQIRNEGDGIPEREPQGEVSDLSEIREAGREDAGSGNGSIQNDGSSGERLSETEPAEKSGVYDGDVAAQTAGEDAGRGNRDDGSGIEVSLKEELEEIADMMEETPAEAATEDEEFNKELEEINSLGRTETGSYEQASFSFAQNGDIKIPEKYTYVKPKTELVVPHDYIRQVLLRGSGFSHGKRRIYEIFDTIADPDERVKRIKKEYGQGGTGRIVDGYGLHGYDTFHGKGLRFQWRDEEGEKEGYLNWNAVERELSVLIMTGEYYQPPKAFNADVVSAALWQEPLDKFFNKGFWLNLPNIALKEVLTKDYPESSKIQFVERVFQTDPYSYSVRSSFSNEYGDCEVERHKWGISVEFYDENGMKWRTELDWRECTAYLESMIDDGVYQTAEEFDKFLEMAESESRVSGINSFKDDTLNFLTDSAEEHQQHRVELVERIVKAVGRDDIEVTWDDTYDVLLAGDGEHLWHGKAAYDYIMENCLDFDQFQRDNRIHFADMAQFKHDAASSIDLKKEKFIHRKTFVTVDKSEEELNQQEEKLWQNALKEYFNEEIQYISVKTLIYDIFTTNLDMNSKAEFLASVYGEDRADIVMTDKVDGPYGESLITRDLEGVTVSYQKPDGTRREHKADYKYCASLILHMIEENDYLSEEIFEQFRISPQSFQASPAFMEIYHEYKERMRMEPNFEALEAEETELTEPQEVQAEKPETIEKVEGEIIDQSGNVIKAVSTAAFPQALEQVEAMEEDLREALEIYLQGCSVIRPFQPFLQMIVKSDLPKSDKLYFLNRTINHYGGGETHDAYHNNAYGLIEYICNSDSFMVDYKNRQGERKRAAVTYEQIYSVMEYLICAGMLTDNARMEKYLKDFSEKPYERLDALEKQFSDKLQIINARKERENFRFEVSELPKGGQKTRYQWNVEAIRLMKQIEFENRAATPDEQKILARYVGWGGIPQAFDERNESWKKEYEELKSLLSEAEYSNARESVNTAFYTSPEIIEAVYQGLSQLGFKQGTILEPSMGVGHFFGAMPEDMRGSRLYGVEKDDISGRIAKLLYPKAKIRIDGFEEMQFPDNFFDVAVGNIPFGDFKLYDPKYAKHNFRIHDYFFAKALDKVRPGGIVAFVTSKGTLDKANPAVRKYLAERADLIGAVRLPNTAFKESAGTDVTSDIIFLQKREQKIVTEPDWVHLDQTEEGIAVNSYFVEHPEMMLGKMEYDSRMFGNESKYTSCVNHEENFDLKLALS